MNHAPSVEGGRGGCDPRHIHRPLEDPRYFLAAQQLIRSLLIDPYVFSSRPGKGKVSLLESRKVNDARIHSRYLQSLSDRALANQLLATSPDSCSDPLTATNLGLAFLGEAGSQLVILLGSPQLEIERDAVYQRIRRLSRLPIKSHFAQCHLSLGRVDGELPPEVIDALEGMLPDSFTLAPVLPVPTPVDSRLFRV